MKAIIVRLAARLGRYSAVSALSIAVTQVLLLGLLAAGLIPLAANVGAVVGAAVPTWYLYRHWVWRDRDDAGSRWYWASVGVGLVWSTVVVTTVSRFVDDPLLLSVANVLAFGTLWVARLLLMELHVFRPELDPAMPPDPRTVDA